MKSISRQSEIVPKPQINFSQSSVATVPIQLGTAFTRQEGRQYNEIKFRKIHRNTEK